MYTLLLDWEKAFDKVDQENDYRTEENGDTRRNDRLNREHI